MAAKEPRRIANWQYLLRGPDRSAANIGKQATILQTIQNFHFVSQNSLAILIDILRPMLQDLYGVDLFELLYFNDDSVYTDNVEIISNSLLSRVIDALPTYQQHVHISDDITTGTIAIRSVNLYAIVCVRRKHEADDLHAFFHFMFDQIRHEVIATHEREVLLIKASLAEGLFDHGSNSRTFVKRMITLFDDFIPNFPHFPRKSQIITQLLIVDYEKDSNFTIAASSTGDGENRTVKHDESLAGLAAKASERSTQYETRLHRNLYKSFTKHSVRRELISKISYQDRLIGLLNIEVTFDKNFCRQYIFFVERYCSSIAPFVAGSINQSYEERQRSLSLMYVFSSMSRDVSATFAHSIEQPLFRIVNSAHNIETLMRTRGGSMSPEVNATIIKTVDIVNKSIDTIREEASDLMVQLPTNVQIGAIPIRSLITTRVDKIKDGLLNENIVIGVKPGEDYDVYASSLLSRHILDLVDNSIDSIREALALEIRRRGNISISFKRTADKDSIGNETGLSIISIIVQDNGLGASREWLSKIGQHKKTTKQGGHGFGVFAARSYCQFFNGSLSWRNVERHGKIVGFQMTAQLIQFDPTIHPNGDVTDFLQRQRIEQ